MTPEEFLTQQYERLSSEHDVHVPVCEDGCYCGVKWLMSHKLRQKLSTNFGESCRLHDLYYELPKMNLKLADKTFYKHMMLQARDSFKLKMTAKFYFAFVTVFRIIRR